VKSRSKILNKLYTLRKEIEHAEAMSKSAEDVGDLIGQYTWSETANKLESEAVCLRQALTKAGTFGRFANPASNYFEGVWI
jgi:hypothetical protein